MRRPEIAAARPRPWAVDPSEARRVALDPGQGASPLRQNRPMTDTTAPAAASATPPPTEDAKKRRRELVEKLLARPAVKSEGEVRLGGKAMAYATALEFMPVTGPVFTDTGGEPEAAVFTTPTRSRAPTQRRAAGVLCLQRRAGLGVDLAAPGRARPQARRRSTTTARCRCRRMRCRTTRSPGSSTSTWCSSTRRTPATRSRERRGAQEAALGRRRRRRAGRGGARLAGAAQALGLAVLPGRRELRHDARRGARRQAAERSASRCRA